MTTITKENFFKATYLICQHCKKQYTNNIKKYSISQYKKSKYCSIGCAGKAKMVIDEHSNRGERYRRKKGMKKQGSPEWLELIRGRTSEAMYKPETQQKLRKAKQPMTIETKAKISKALAGKMPKNMMFNNNYGHFRNGDYDINGKTIYFRSGWEANVALYLDFLIEQKEIKSWEYEPYFFKFDAISHGTTRYLPDFKVVNNDDSEEFWEVKGYMDSKSKTKLKRMAKYYPDVKLVLIDSTYYNDLKKKLGAILKFY